MPAKTVKPTQWFSRKARKQPSRLRSRISVKCHSHLRGRHARCPARKARAQAGLAAQQRPARQETGRRTAMIAATSARPSVIAEVLMPIFRSSSRSTIAYSVS